MDQQFFDRMMMDFESFSDKEKYCRQDLKYRISRFMQVYPEYKGRQLYIHKHAKKR